MKSIIYLNRHIYNLAMRLSYGRHYPDRFRKIAELVEKNSSVLDVCCGPCNLFAALAPKNIRYRGLDINEHFVETAKKRGIDARVFDVCRGTLPQGEFDYVIMQSSLYQFIPDEKNMVSTLLKATKKYVIIAEPIVNMADRVPSFLAKIVKKLKDPGNGPAHYTFNDGSFTELIRSSKGKILRCLYVDGGKEKIYLLER